MRLRYRPLPRKADAALLLLAILLLLFGSSLVDSGWHRAVDHAVDRALVRELGLSDLSLFTEARYTRHPTQADGHSPFQDHPAALDHFPTGALLPPPPTLTSPAR